MGLHVLSNPCNRKLGGAVHAKHDCRLNIAQSPDPNLCSIPSRGLLPTLVTYYRLCMQKGLKSKAVYQSNMNHIYGYNLYVQAKPHVITKQGTANTIYSNDTSALTRILRSERMTPNYGQCNSNLQSRLV